MSRRSLFDDLLTSLTNAKQPEPIVTRLLHDCPSFSKADGPAVRAATMPPPSHPVLGSGLSGSAIDVGAPGVTVLTDKQRNMAGVAARYFAVAVGRCYSMLLPAVGSWIGDLPHLSPSPANEAYAYCLIHSACGALKTTPNSAITDVVVDVLETFSRSEGVRGWLDRVLCITVDDPSPSGGFADEDVGKDRFSTMLGILSALSACAQVSFFPPGQRQRIEGVCISLMTHVFEGGPGDTGRAATTPSRLPPSPSHPSSATDQITRLKAAILGVLRQLLARTVSNLPLPATGSAPVLPSAASRAVTLAEQEFLCGAQGSREAALELLLTCCPVLPSLRGRVGVAVLRELPGVCSQLTPHLPLLLVLCKALVTVVIDVPVGADLASQLKASEGGGAIGRTLRCCAVRGATVFGCSRRMRRDRGAVVEALLLPYFPRAVACVSAAVVLPGIDWSLCVRAMSELQLAARFPHSLSLLLCVPPPPNDVYRQLTDASFETATCCPGP